MTAIICITITTTIHAAARRLYAAGITLVGDCDMERHGITYDSSMGWTMDDAMSAVQHVLDGLWNI